MSAWRSAIGPNAAPPAFLNATLPSLSDPVSLMIVSGVINPPSSAAVAVIGLNVDPVGYRPWIARFDSGYSADSESSWSSTDCGTVGRVNTEGS